MSWAFNPFTGALDQTSSASPGGSDTQIQFNDGDAFGGDSGLTFDKTTGKLTVGGKTVTAASPVLDLSQTWNNAAVAFNGIKLNVTDTASSASSLLMDLQVGGMSRFIVGKDGKLTISNGSTSDGLYVQGGISAASGNFGCFGSSAQSFSLGHIVGSLSYFGWSSSQFGTTLGDLAFYRDAANTLAQRNSTNAQESRVYATYTDATNYQRCGIKTGKTTLSNVSGATVTATGLIPAGALLIGVTSRVNTTCTTATGYTVGTSGDPDLWGVASAVAAGTATGSANFTAAGASGLFTAATDVIVTATGGNFDGTGVIELSVHYLLTEAD